MEELQINIFTTKNLPIDFHPQIWRKISQLPAQKFQIEQYKLYELFQKDESLKAKYFERFQKNHLNLYGWSLLASREKAQIEPYLFRPIMQKTPSFKSKIRKVKFSCYPHRSSKTEPNQIRKLMGNNSISKQNLKLITEEVDSHELYLQTFAACRGDHYVPYDYTRHMKSGMQRSYYNSFIRPKHKRNHSNPAETQNALSKFMEWTQMKEKTSLLSFRSILSNKKLNSQRGLQTLLKRKGSQKLVFVNHQRKPVNYFFRPVQKP